jgi:hypothetical protein
MCLVVFRAPWDVSEVDVECSQLLAELLDDLDRCFNDFWANTISWDRRDTVRSWNCRCHFGFIVGPEQCVRSDESAEDQISGPPLYIPS